MFTADADGLTNPNPFFFTHVVDYMTGFGVEIEMSKGVSLDPKRNYMNKNMLELEELQNQPAPDDQVSCILCL